MLSLDQKQNSVNIKKDLENMQEILPLLIKCLTYGFIAVPLFIVTVFNFNFLVFGTVLSNDVTMMTLVFSVIIAFGHGILKVTGEENEDNQQSRLEKMKERILKSEHLHEDLKGCYVAKVNAEPANASALYNEFVKQEERIRKVKRRDLLG